MDVLLQRVRSVSRRQIARIIAAAEDDCTTFRRALLFVLALPKSRSIWNEPVSTGSAGALARRSVRSTLNLKPLDAVTVSRFALIAGEGARAPSISLSLSAIPLFEQGLCAGYLRRKNRPGL